MGKPEQAKSSSALTDPWEDSNTNDGVRRQGQIMQPLEGF